MAAAMGGVPFLQMPVHVLDHDDGVVDHKPDGQHQGQQRQQIDGESEREA